jgi:hypothetical protein
VGGPPAFWGTGYAAGLRHWRGWNVLPASSRPKARTERGRGNPACPVTADRGTRLSAGMARYLKVPSRAAASTTFDRPVVRLSGRTRRGAPHVTGTLELRRGLIAVTLRSRGRSAGLSGASGQDVAIFVFRRLQ